MKTWDQVYRDLLVLPRGQRLRFLQSELPSPATAGFELSEGLSYGQSADWRRLEAGDESLHVEVFPGVYDCHLDTEDPRVDPARHLVRDVIGAGDIPMALALLAVLFSISIFLD
jgi:hypothetical protein